MDLLKIFSSRPSSKEVAKDRLQLILIHDRSDISPEFLEMLKGDLLKVIEKYAELDCGEIDMRLIRTEQSEGNAPALVASIPIKKRRNNV